MTTIMEAWLYVRPLKRGELVATLRISLGDALISVEWDFYARVALDQIILPTVRQNKLGMVWHDNYRRIGFSDDEVDRRRELR